MTCTIMWVRGGSVIAHSKVNIKLYVDLATASVEALVVPDYAQDISIIVGQPFLKHKNVTFLVRGNQIRNF